MDFYGINVKDDITGDGTPNLGSVGNPFGHLYGESTSARYADLAEKYSCETTEEVGTVMCVSVNSNADVEACNEDLSASCVGIVSLNPAFKMNENNEGIFVGLVGLLPVKIVGPINRNDFIVPTVNGCARKGKIEELVYKIGIALESKSDDSVSLITCIIK